MISLKSMENLFVKFVLNHVCNLMIKTITTLIILYFISFSYACMENLTNLHPTFSNLDGPLSVLVLYPEVASPYPGD